MPEHLRRGDVVNLKPEYIKYAVGGNAHYGEEIAGSSWVVDWIYYSQTSAERLVFAKPLQKDGQYLEMINGAAVPESYLVKNQFLTAVHRATSGPRREE